MMDSARASGYQLPALPLSGWPPTVAQTVIGADFVKRLIGDPRQFDRAKATGAPEIAAIRNEIQRRFIGSKAKNVAPYRGYIERFYAGSPGLIPPIILYTPHAVALSEGHVEIPWSAPLIVLDGETQVAARLESADPAVAQSTIPALLIAGWPITAAQQAFHDLHRFGVNMTAAHISRLDLRDPYVQLGQELTLPVPADPNVRRWIAAYTVVGVRDRVPVVPDLPAEWREFARVWWRGLTELLHVGPDSVVEYPVVLYALAALPWRFGPVGDQSRDDTQLSALITTLGRVDWHRERWIGICVRRTEAGSLVRIGDRSTSRAVMHTLNTNPPLRAAVG